MEKKNYWSVSLKDLLKENLGWYLNKSKERSRRRGLPTGLIEFDELTDGLRPSELIVFGGRPAMGKTALIMSIIRHLAIKEKKRIVIFRSDAAREDFTRRILCVEARVALSAIRIGRLNISEKEKIRKAATRLAKAGIHICDDAFTVEEINEELGRLAAAGIRADVVFVDSLQSLIDKKKMEIRIEEAWGRLCESDDPDNEDADEDRREELAEISRNLKKLAVEMKIPIVVTSHLSRRLECRRDKRPVLGDLYDFDSGALARNADVIALLYKERYYHPNAMDESELIVQKNKYGPTGYVKLAFIQKYARFENLCVIRR